MDSCQRSRVVVADDHEDVLREITRLLAPEFDVVRSVREGVGLLEAVHELKPDAVISDISMPGLDGIEAARRIRQDQPGPSIIILTMHNDPMLVRSALTVGVQGYVLKLDAGEELIAALRTVISGRTYLSRGVTAP